MKQQAVKKERIAKIMAHAGIASRRKAEALIREGRVCLNGRVVTDVATGVNRAVDTVSVDGQQIATTAFVYLVMNKPRGYVVTRHDPHAKKTVYALLPARYRGLHPVGRLDKETSGLLLFTNDGNLTQRITHPRFEVRKKYEVTLRGTFRDEDRKKIETGFRHPEFTVSACGIEDLAFDRRENKTRFILDIGEGKKREIRKIFDHFGYELLRLHRVQIGGLQLWRVAMGRYRVLSEEEVATLTEKKETPQGSAKGG